MAAVIYYVALAWSLSRRRMRGWGMADASVWKTRKSKCYMRWCRL
jgi:hypothetical protein